MHGFLAILITFHLLTLSLSYSKIEEINRNSAEIEPKDANLYRRKLPIFPKNTIKFVMTPKPRQTTNTAYIHKLKEKIMPKMALLLHTTLKPKEETSITLPRRKPLMKLRAFTIKPRANEKPEVTQENSQTKAYKVNKPENLIKLNTSSYPEIEKDIATVTYVTEKEKKENLIEINRRSNPTTEQEDIATEVYIPEENQIKIKNLHYNKVQAADTVQPNQESDQIKDKFLFEEEEDHNEFIFLENENEEHSVDFQDNIEQEFDRDSETTTEFKIMDRVKRSNNIIEEENMSSTVSGFKYTGRDTRLNNNFYFKNINS